MNYKQPNFKLWPSLVSQSKYKVNKVGATMISTHDIFCQFKCISFSKIKWCGKQSTA